MIFFKLKLGQQFFLIACVATLFIVAAFTHQIYRQRAIAELKGYSKQVQDIERGLNKLEELITPRFSEVGYQENLMLHEHTELTGYALEQLETNLKSTFAHNALGQEASKLMRAWQNTHKSLETLKYHTEGTLNSQRAISVQNDLHYLKQQLLKLELKLERTLQKRQMRNRTYVLIALALGLLYTWFTLWYLHKAVLKPIKKTTKSLRSLAEGKEIAQLPEQRYDELGELMGSINQLSENFNKLSHFAQKIGRGEFDADLELRSDNDTLVKALRAMRENLDKFVKEDEKQLWTSNGLSELSNILSNHQEEWEALCHQVTAYMVQYLAANQGGLFILSHGHGEEPTLELQSAYAYGKRKHIEKRFSVNHGLIGQCFQEGRTVKLMELPQGYTRITSGLGESTPEELLLLPLKMNDKTVGVLEIASFRKFEQQHINFAEKAAEHIATTIIGLENNRKTKRLLEEANSTAQQMREQEDLLKENLQQLANAQEGLQKIQKDTERREKNMRSIINGTQQFICAADLNGKILFLNEQFIHWPIALEKVPTKGTEFVSLFPAYKRNKVVQMLQKAAKGEQLQQTENFLTAGTEFYLTIEMSTIKTGPESVGAIAIFMSNVTEINPIRQ